MLSTALFKKRGDYMKVTKISRFALFAVCGLVLSGCGALQY